ncbi:hypothetical protein HOA92_04475 [archaeon]|jgi:uncharacterized HAD superfamily protein|nr:hypothetical protein [archaeon]MBT6762271.1 hypothetical protein [archaeon]
MKITVDLDDVLGPYMPAFLNFYNERHETRHIVSDLVTYSLEKCLGVPESIIGPLVDEFAMTETYAKLPVTSGAYKILKKLKDEGHDLSVLTFRKNETRFVTEDWVSKNYAGIFSDVAYTNGKSTKGELAVRMGSRLHIDDSPKHTRSVAARGIDVLLYDAHWNQHVGFEDGIYRVNCFSELPGKVARVEDKLSQVYHI